MAENIEMKIIVCTEQTRLEMKWLYLYRLLSSILPRMRLQRIDVFPYEYVWKLSRKKEKPNERSFSANDITKEADKRAPKKKSANFLQTLIRIFDDVILHGT